MECNDRSPTKDGWFCVLLLFSTVSFKPFENQLKCVHHLSKSFEGNRKTLTNGRKAQNQPIQLNFKEQLYVVIQLQTQFLLIPNNSKYWILPSFSITSLQWKSVKSSSERDRVINSLCKARRNGWNIGTPVGCPFGFGGTVSSIGVGFLLNFARKCDNILFQGSSGLFLESQSHYSSKLNRGFPCYHKGQARSYQDCKQGQDASKSSCTHFIYMQRGTLVPNKYMYPFSL